MIVVSENPKVDINYIARAPKQNNRQNKNIVCLVHSSYMKNDVVAAAKRHKTLKPSYIGLLGTNIIFVNDPVTIENKVLLNKTKIRARERGFRIILGSRMQEYAKKNVTSPKLHIKSERDLRSC